MRYKMSSSMLPWGNIVLMRRGTKGSNFAFNPNDDLDEKVLNVIE